MAVGGRSFLVGETADETCDETGDETDAWCQRRLPLHLQRQQWERMVANGSDKQASGDDHPHRQKQCHHQPQSGKPKVDEISAEVSSRIRH